MDEDSSREPGVDRDAAQLVDLATHRRVGPDELVVAVPRGGRVVVFADVRMTPGGTDASREASRALARGIEDFRGPGVVVLAGDVFDLGRERRPDVDAALAAHPRLASALTSFCETPDRRIVLLPGTRDAAFAHDAGLVDAMQAHGWEVALTCL